MLEHQQARNLYEEARKLLNTAKTQHIMQLEEIRLIINGPLIQIPIAMYSVFRQNG